MEQGSEQCRSPGLMLTSKSKLSVFGGPEVGGSLFWVGVWMERLTPSSAASDTIGRKTKVCSTAYRKLSLQFLPICRHLESRNGSMVIWLPSSFEVKGCDASCSYSSSANSLSFSTR